MAKRTYPLEVNSVGDDKYIVMSRGHHDFDEFMLEAVKQFPGRSLGGPVHRWVKAVPDLSGEYIMVYVFVPRGTRGSWPATYCYEYGEGYKQWNDDQKESGDE